MSDDVEQLKKKVAALDKQVARLKHRPVRRTVRKRSKTMLFGLPLYEIAIGPDPKHHEARGYARAIFAIGDIAVGVFAVGGISAGFVSIGGISAGGITVGGVALGLLAGLGGVASGAVAAGGVAIGGFAAGGLVIGGSGIGGHIIKLF
jgi:hypothetical protein